MDCRRLVPSYRSLVEAISHADAYDLRGESVGRKTQPLLVLVLGSYIDPCQNVIVDAAPHRKYVIGKICGRTGLRIAEHRGIVENPSPIHYLGVRRKTSIVQNVSRSDLVCPFINAVYRIRIVDLVKLPLDSDVECEI